jgi:hypothetical protein
VPAPKPLHYIQREGAEAGPYDLVQMAALLRKKIIDGQTLTRREGEDAWMPFSWQPLFSVAREMPAEATSMRLEELDEETLDRQSPIPLPSQENVIRIIAGIVGLLVLGAGAYALAWLDHTVGIIVAAAGAGVAAIASVLILSRMLDEDIWTWAGLIFVPLYDWFYFISRLPLYWRLLCLKYAGMAVMFGAAWGLQHWQK